MRQIRVVPLAAALAAAVISSIAAAPAKGKPISWKGIDDALLLVNDNPAKDWAIFQNGNKRDPLLLQIGGRFLLLRIHDRQIFEIDKSKVQFKSDEAWMDPADHPAEALATTDWDAADIEAVFRIRVKLAGENRMLDIELPHQLDLSRESPHPASRR